MTPAARLRARVRELVRNAGGRVSARWAVPLLMAEGHSRDQIQTARERVCRLTGRGAGAQWHLNTRPPWEPRKPGPKSASRAEHRDAGRRGGLPEAIAPDPRQPPPGQAHAPARPPRAPRTAPAAAGPCWRHDCRGCAGLERRVNDCDGRTV